jgi:hypothetical protein
MALGKQKSDVVNKLKLYITMANTVRSDDVEDLLEDADDPIDFMLTLIKTTIGENVVESLVQKLLGQVLLQKTLDELSDKIYDAIGSGLPETSALPDDIKQNGVTLNLKSIDTSDSLKKPSSEINNNPFFKKMKDEVLTVPDVSIPVTIPIFPQPLTLKYIESTNEVNTKLPPALSVKEVFDGLRGFIGPLFSSEVVVSEIMNILFHTEFTDKDAQILTLVRSYTKYENKDVFKLDLNKLLNLQLDTEKRGLNVDTSCFRENIDISQEQINNVIANPSVQSFNALVPEANNDITTNIKNDYHKSLIKTIVEALLMIVLKQPGVMFIVNLINKVINVGSDIALTIPEIFEKLKKLIESIFDNIHQYCFCIIFNFVKKYVIRIVVGVTIIILKEQLERRAKILASLSGIRARINI